MPKNPGADASNLPDGAGNSPENASAVAPKEKVRYKVVRRVAEPSRRILREVNTPNEIHPALIPGISVEQTTPKFTTNWTVFVVAGILTAAFIVWGILDTEGLESVASAALIWTTDSFGWLFNTLTIAVFMFMLWVGFGRYGRIRLGMDDEKPEFSTFSWIAMLFAAGMGIGLMFFGPYEPLAFFTDLPPLFSDLEPGSREAMLAAMSQTMFHWGPMAWSYYALVGGAVAYAAYRRGRSPLMSSLLEPIFGERTRGPLGAIIDIAAILVTLFGTAVSLGIGAMQIGRGVEIVGGLGQVGNGIIIGIIVVLTVVFITSAVSGVKRGIRILSNINLVMTGCLALFVFVAGPMIFLLNFAPSALMAFVGDFVLMLRQGAVYGPDSAQFMRDWTTYYWAWWVSWTPFVGLFIAKISRGRTLRQFVGTVIIVPSAVCLVWFAIFGGATMWFEEAGARISESERTQDILFALLNELPFGMVTSVIAMIAIVIFFVTSADSASLVMAGLSQRGNPAPSPWATITWGIGLGGIAIVMLLVGGESALNGLQSLVIVTALPFAFVLILVMIAWAKELSRDPYTIRRRYAREAIVQGVRDGIENYGDDFVFAAGASEPDRGAGAWLDSEDPALTDWYEAGGDTVVLHDGDGPVRGPHLGKAGDNDAAGDAGTDEEAPKN
ncbi:BCCT family transporter [Humidisolicoccus flavus]|uniref:BCCT family transporter n=1 Tax=Humidisolicoccus flavus TaxID=3111414 RepID=UPI00325555F0